MLYNGFKYLHELTIYITVQNELISLFKLIFDFLIYIFDYFINELTEY